MGIICPVRSSEQYKELVTIFGSHEMAHMLWNRNGGYPLDFNPIGETSTLFKELLQITNNDRYESMRLKAQYYLTEYTDVNGKWYEEFATEPLLGNVASPNSLINLASMLSHKLGYEWDFALPGEIPEGKIAGFRLTGKNPVVLIDKTNFATGDILHEFGHLLIEHIKRDNHKLYDNLVKEAKLHKRYNELVDIVEKEYIKYPTIAKESEVLTYLLEDWADGLVDQETGLFRALTEVWEYIRKFIADLFGIVNVATLTPKTTMEQLAYMLADPDIKLDLGDKFGSGEFLESYSGEYDLSGNIPFKTKKNIKDIPGMENITPEGIKNIFIEHAKQFEEETDPTIAKEKGHFKFKKDKAYEYLTGVKRVCKKYGYGFKGKEDPTNINIRVGSTIHGHIENISNDIVEDVSGKYGVQLTAQAKKDLQSIFKELKGKYTALSEVAVADLNTGIIGVIDLVLISDDNRIMLFDFKTKLRGYWTDKNGERQLSGSKFNFWEKGYKGDYSDKEVAHLQLSMYAYLVQKVLKLPVSSINVVKLDAITTGERNSKNQDVISSIEVFSESEDILEESFYNKKGDILLHNATMRLIEGNDAYLNNKTLENKFKIERDEYDDVYAKVTKSESEAGIWLDKLIDELNARVDISRKRFDAGGRKSIEELITNIQSSESVTEALEWIIYNAYNEIQALDKELAEYKKEGKEFTPGILYRWKDAVQAYKTLDKLRIALMENPDMVPNKKYLNALNYISDKTAYFEEKYKKEGRYLIAKWLTPFYNGIKVKYIDSISSEYRKLKHKEIKKGKMSLSEFEKTYGDIKDYVNSRIDNKKVEKETYRMLYEELEIASKDIGELTRWLDNMLDTSDAVASALVNAFVQADETARLEAIDKKYDIIDAVEALHKVRPKGNYQSEESYYSFMLEHDENGDPTQYLLKPYRSSFWEDINKIRKEEKLSKSKEEISSAIREFQKENRQWDRDAFDEALIEFIEESYNKEQMSKEEYDALIEYISINPSLYINHIDSIEELTEETISKIEYWYGKHKSLFFIYSDKYINPEWDKFMHVCGIDTKLSLYKQYQELNKSENPYAKFYNFIEQMNKEAGQMIPNGYRLWDRLPGVVKLNSERIKAGQNPLTILKANMDTNLFVRPEDIERGNKEVTNEFGRIKYFIPIHYTARIEKDYQSYDLPGIYFKFWESANSYRNKRKILPELEMARFFINDRKAYKRNVFKQIMSTNGNLDDEKKEVAKKDTTILANMFNDWFEMALYGKYTKDEALLLDVSTKKKQQSIDLMKFVNVLNRYTSLNLLGGNVVQGFANVAMGETMQAIENIAHEYVSPKNYSKATALYTRYLPQVLGDVGREAPQSLAGRLFEEFNVLDDEVTTMFTTNTATNKFLRNTSIYFVQHAGEHWLQNRFLIAMLLEKKAYDKLGKPLGSMMDQYEVRDGKLKLKENVSLEKSEWTTKDQQLFKRKIKGILSRIHGEYSDLGRVAIQRTALGRMAYLFRKFIVPGFRRRWGSREYVERLGQYTEGNYISTLRFFKNYWKDLLTLNFSVMGENWAGLSDHEKANIRRTISEAAFLIAIIIMAAALYNAKDEDDDDNWFLSFLAYQAYRLKAELTFFVSLDSAMQIMRSPMASTAVLQNIASLTSQLSNPTELYQRGPFKGELKLKKIALDFIPVYKQIYKARDIEQQINWFRN